MTIIYNIPSHEDSIKLFGKRFIKNNRDNCYLLVDGQQKKLCEYLTLNQKQKNKDTIKIKLIETNTITNMNGMFSGVKTLKSLPDISKWDSKNVTNTSYMFNDYRILTKLSEISEWEPKNVTNMLNCYDGSPLSSHESDD